MPQHRDVVSQEGVRQHADTELRAALT